MDPMLFLQTVLQLHVRPAHTITGRQTDVGRGKTSCDLVTAHPKAVLLLECAVMVSGMSEVLLLWCLGRAVD